MWPSGWQPFRAPINQIVSSRQVSRMNHPLHSPVFENRAFSEKIAELGLQCGSLLNQMHELAEEQLSPELRPQFRQALAPLLVGLNTALLMPIFARYPDLEPHEPE